MRTYLLKTKTNSRRRSSTRRLVSIIIIGLVAVLFLWLFNRFFGNAASYVVQPLYEGATALSNATSGISGYFKSKATLIAQKNELEEKIKEESSREVLLEAYRAENEMLRDIKDNAHDLIVAEVLSHPKDTPYDTFLIDAGSNVNIVEGALVYGAKDVAVGTIVKVYGRMSLVRLFSSYGVVGTAYVFGPDVFVPIRGMGGGVLRVEVPQGLSLSSRDPVLLPALSHAVYGAIHTVEKDESEPNQYGFLEMPVNVQSLRFVTVAREAFVPLAAADIATAVESASTTINHAVSVPREIPVSTTTVETTL